MTKPSPSRNAAFAIVILWYLLAFTGAAAFLSLAQVENIYLRILGTDVLATVIIYLGSVIHRNASLYDPYWSVIPIWIVFYLMFLVDFEVSTGGALAAIAILVWGIRLTWNWASQWKGMQHEDWRYVNLRAKSGKWFWLVNFSGIQLFPTLLVYLGCMSLVPAIKSDPNNPANWLTHVAFAVCMVAVLIEGRADQQLKDFKKTNTKPRSILKSGLWKFVRHPNYTGEILFWWGIFLFAIAENTANWWMIAGPLCITALFFFISVPMIDRRMISRRPDYRDHIKSTPGIFPGLKF